MCIAKDVACAAAITRPRSAQSIRQLYIDPSRARVRHTCIRDMQSSDIEFIRFCFSEWRGRPWAPNLNIDSMAMAIPANNYVHYSLVVKKQIKVAWRSYINKQFEDDVADVSASSIYGVVKRRLTKKPISTHLRIHSGAKETLTYSDERHAIARHFNGVLDGYARAFRHRGGTCT